MKITYKYIEGYDKKYIVSNFGDVISLKRKKFDHIDRVRTNNRADNLRLATKSEQEINKNMNSRNTTGERNVSIIRTGNYACYRIKIERNGKKIVKQLNMKTHTIADAIKYRDEQLELLSRI